VSAVDPVWKILYSSEKTDLFDSGAINEILLKFRNHNSSRKITGELIYSQGLFFQVIEGEKKEVEALFEKIKADKRHSEIFIIGKYWGTREYISWSMRYTRLENKELLTSLIDNLANLLEKVDSGDNEHKDVKVREYSAKIIQDIEKTS
jgi:hypothetical protein